MVILYDIGFSSSNGDAVFEVEEEKEAKLLNSWPDPLLRLLQGTYKVAG